MRKYDDPDSQHDLYRQDQGDADGEFQMLGLMADGVHTNEAAYAAAQCGNQHEGGFGNAPQIFLRLELVHKHKYEAGCIDNKEVKKDKLKHDDFLSGGIILKKCWILAFLPLLLCGCAAEETFETVADDIVQPVMAQPREITVSLPDDAVAPVLEGDSEQVYMAEDYEIVIETLSSGDLNETIQTISGYPKDQLTIMETQWDDVTRYEFVWASAGENGDRLGRAVILDDGDYHYCMSVLRDAEGTKKSQIVWSEVFNSFALI